MRYKRTVLPNGLRIITVPLHEVKSASALLLIGVGSRYETPQEAGISHFAEHMVFKGTKKRPKAQDIAGAIDSVGGEINAFTSEEYTGFYIKVESHHLALGLDILSDMVLKALFTPRGIERERDVIIEEINMYEDIPGRKVGEVYKELMYPHSALGAPIAGTKRSIKGIKRHHFIRYLDELYTPGNAVVVLAGAVPADAVALIEGCFGVWKAKEARPMPPAPQVVQGPNLRLHYKKTEQAHCVLGFLGFPQGHPTRYAEGLLNVILGGNMSSRLFVTVREQRGLAYAIRSASDHFLDTGSWDVYAGVDLLKAERCVSVILDVLRRVRTNGVTSRELAKAQEYVVGRLALDLEDSQVVASMVGSQELLEGVLRTPEEIAAAVRRVTRTEIVEVARTLFTEERLHVAIVGPFENKKQFESVLAL